MAYVTKSHLADFTEKLLANSKKIRDDLKKDGIILVDTRSGTTYKLEV